MQPQPIPSFISLPPNGIRCGDNKANSHYIPDTHVNGRQVSSSLTRLIDTEVLLDPLTPQQLSERRECEAVIQRGFQAVYDLGKAFARIRDGRLYRDRYATFEAYCRDQWQQGRSYVNRLIAAAVVVEHLVPLGTKMPIRETHVRPLIGLPPEQAVQAWQEAVEAAGKGPITAKLVKRAAAEFKAEELDSKSRKSGKAAKQVEWVDQAIEMIYQVEDSVRTGRNPQTIFTLLARLRGDLLKLK